MKRILTSALAIMLFVGAANAQSVENKQRHEGKRDHRQMVMKGVDLTAEQQAQMEVINKNYRSQLADLKGQSLTVEQLKTKRQALQQKHSSDLHALLTPEQKTKLQSLRNQKRDSTASTTKSRKTDTRKNKGLTHQKQKYDSKNLNLSAEQEAKMKVINESYKAQFDALRQNRTESAEAQKAKLQNLRNERQTAIKEILNPEQQAKIAEYRKRPRNVKK